MTLEIEWRKQLAQQEITLAFASLEEDMSTIPTTSTVAYKLHYF